MKNICPCYGCTEHKAGCHSGCEKYAEWKTQHEAAKQARDEAKRKDRSMREYYVDLAKNIRKGEHK